MKSTTILGIVICLFVLIGSFQNCSYKENPMLVEKVEESSEEVDQLNNTFNFEVYPNQGEVTEVPVDRSEMIDPPERGTQKQNYTQINQYPVFRFYQPRPLQFQYSIEADEMAASGGAETFVYEGIGFRVFSIQLSDSRALYQCYDPDNKKHYLSLDQFCEPSLQNENPQNLRRIGFIAGDYTDGAKARLYRCFHRQKNAHLVTVYRNECEAYGYEVEGVLGFVRYDESSLRYSRFRRTEVFRMLDEDGKRRLSLNSDGVIGTDRLTKEFSSPFQIFRLNYGGMSTLYQCFNITAGSYFPSVDSQCENNTSSASEILGYLSQIPTRDTPQVYYRCLSTIDGHRYMSIDPSCEFKEGYLSEGVLGYGP